MRRTFNRIFDMTQGDRKMLVEYLAEREDEFLEQMEVGRDEGKNPCYAPGRVDCLGGGGKGP
jgi:hypothetical protein